MHRFRLQIQDSRLIPLPKLPEKNNLPAISRKSTERNS